MCNIWLVKVRFNWLLKANTLLEMVLPVSAAAPPPQVPETLSQTRLSKGKT